MKRKNLFIIFCITALTLSACGKTETPVMSNSVETEVETETITTDEIIAEEVEEPTDDISNEITEETVENTTNTEEIPSNGEGQVDTPSSDGFSEGSGFNPAENITQNPDGSYSFSENFMVSVQTIDGFSDLTPENQQKLLQEIAPLIGEDDNEEDVIAALSSFVGMYEYDEAVAKQEQAQQKPQQTTGGQNNNSTPPASSQAPADNIGPGPMDYIFDTPSDGTAGSHDENAATGGVGTHHTPPPSQEQVIGGPPCADGTASGPVGTITPTDWR